MRTLISICSFCMFTVIIVAWAIVTDKAASTGLEQYRKNYTKPDTTITYQSGKWDTTIIIKQLPAWLK